MLRISLFSLFFSVLNYSTSNATDLMSCYDSGFWEGLESDYNAVVAGTDKGLLDRLKGFNGIVGDFWGDMLNIAKNNPGGPVHRMMFSLSKQAEAQINALKGTDGYIHLGSSTTALTLPPPGDLEQRDITTTDLKTTLEFMLATKKNWPNPQDSVQVIGLNTKDFFEKNFKINEAFADKEDAIIVGVGASVGGSIELSVGNFKICLWLVLSPTNFAFGQSYHHQK